MFKQWIAVAGVTAMVSGWSAGAGLAAGGVPGVVPGGGAGAGGAAERAAAVPGGATAGPAVSAMLANVRPCTHYVSPGGSDAADGTSPSKAWQTLAVAVPRLRAGN